MRALSYIAAAAMLFLAAAAAPPAAAQTFAEALAAAKRGDYATAYRGFRHFAERGNSVAQFYLGLMYSKGQGVARDYAKAAKWYRHAATNGLAEAQYNLGLMYEKGRGVLQDYAEAAKWYLRAAEQNITQAQHNLAVMYTVGRGVPQDYGEAARWYRRAAGRGIARAQYNLGLMYENGQGVRRDLVRAHKWYNLAASRFSDEQKDLRARAVKSRNRVAARLTRAQRARAQRLARVWRPGTGNARSQEGSGHRRVAAVQRDLARLGYDPGPADGVTGPRTRAAIRAFQAVAGLPVDGRVSGKLERAVRAALRRIGRAAAESPTPRRQRKQVSTGSGFRVSAGGHILTNAHVVRGCTEVRVPPSPGTATRRVAVAAQDKASDLALLKGPAGAPFARFRAGRGVRPGARVVVAGYPLRGVLAAGVNISAGTVAALAGPGNDRRLIQITAPVQPGNSGGPVLDAAGNVAGVVVAKLNAIRIARATGDIPQNVNFAVSAGTARAFLDSEEVAYETAPSGTARAPEDVAAAAKRFTVLVECWK